MKNANYKYIILGLSLFLCLSNLISFTFLHNYLNGTRDQENNIPKLSTQEIIIISPEEKDYLTPMSGYHPATYSFTHEIPGTIGTDIDFVDIYYKSGFPSGYFDAFIYSEWQGHHEVLILQDAQSGYYLYVEHKNFNETNGTIEWFWGMNQPSQNSFFRLMKNDTVAFGIRISNFNFIYDGNTTSTVTSCSSNTWYHNSLSFDCNAAGNGQFTWVISRENGTEIARAENIGFSNNVASIDTIHLETTNVQTSGHSAFFDAFGFTWEGYVLGDNLKEGILVDFTPNNLNWMTYSLDGQANETILGNIIIPFPDDGLHTIQVFGNDSGILYASEIRNFAVGVIPTTIMIKSPRKNEFYGIGAPSFSITILSINVSKMWYTLDNGIKNFTFNELTKRIDQTEWENYENGSVTIKFYANDTLGVVGSAEVTVLKDTFAPRSSIHFTPHSGIDKVIKSTNFTLTADDGKGSGISVIRYRINNSNWIDYNEPFNLTNYSYGYYLISYQSIDKVNNGEHINIELIELVSDISKPSQPRIPGYHIFLLIGIICIVSVKLIKKQHKL